MTPLEAKNTLLLHAGFIVTDEKPGFLGRLRLFQGLDERDFAEIAESDEKKGQVHLHALLDLSPLCSLPRRAMTF
jgi:hypothetical protein